jgi:hypothetical protein
VDKWIKSIALKRHFLLTFMLLQAKSKFNEGIRLKNCIRPPKMAEGRLTRSSYRDAGAREGIKRRTHKNKEGLSSTQSSPIQINDVY